jgi:hypothetical protein
VVGVLKLALDALDAHDLLGVVHERRVGQEVQREQRQRVAGPDDHERDVADDSGDVKQIQHRNARRQHSFSSKVS